MNLTTLAWLRSPAGQALLDDLAARALDEHDVLRELTRLRATYAPELARAALEQTLLRRRARPRFSQADRLYFTREALEQATSERVAAYRARRFARALEDGQVVDCCCGIGGDALALAGAGLRVTAIDRDELRLALAAANAETLGLTARIHFVQADVLSTALPAADALFCDPGRRSGERRRFHVEQYEPPLSRVLAWRTHTPALAVKLSPGVDLAEVPTDPAVELEFVSLDGELKEAILWCGPLATAQRRATVLRRDSEAAGVHDGFSLTGDPLSPPPCPLAPPQAFLYEPDPAVLRAGLVTHVAVQLGAAQLDPQIAYLTAPQHIQSPFARVWRVLEWHPFTLKRLRARMRELDAGPVTVKKRGSPLDSDALARQLSGGGARPLVVVLTQVQGKAAVLICATME